MSSLKYRHQDQAEEKQKAQLERKSPFRKIVGTCEELMFSLPSSTVKVSISPVCLYDLGSTQFLIFQAKFHSLIIREEEPDIRTFSIAKKSGKPKPGEVIAFRYGPNHYWMNIEFISVVDGGTENQKFTLDITDPEALNFNK